MSALSYSSQPFAKAIDADRDFCRKLFDDLEIDREQAQLRGDAETAIAALNLQLAICRRLDRAHRIMRRRYPDYDQLFTRIGC